MPQNPSTEPILHGHTTRQRGPPTASPLPFPTSPSFHPNLPFDLRLATLCVPNDPHDLFPPPFLSPPSSSFSDPLTTHGLSQDKRLSVEGELVRGLNNGDDAIIVAENFIGVDDGMSRSLTFSFPDMDSGLETPITLLGPRGRKEFRPPHAYPRPGRIPADAYEETLRATTSPTEWLGTTTSATAILHCTKERDGIQRPLLYVTNLGDCKIPVIRPSEKKVLFRTAEQWHCLLKVAVQEDDVVLALSDGVMDNLWEHEVLKVVIDSIDKWEEGRAATKNAAQHPHLSDDRNVYVARELLNAALTIAQDPFAESPFMEKAVEEGLAIEGGKRDDISVVIASCKKSDG
ncbi:hypothetical protein N7497_012374 [Penicillium chrysogenum]|nr:hypothetical protein N7497_012374 [Penicillium chrysogenum]